MSHDTIFADYAAHLREFIRDQAALRDSSNQAPEEKSFNGLALGLFALQFKHNPVLRKLCQSRGVTSDSITDWRQIPAVPASAFKEMEVTSLPAAERTTVFHSSATTGQKPSCHFHNAESLALYEASLLPWFDAHLLAELPLTPALSPSNGERENHLQVYSQSNVPAPNTPTLKAFPPLPIGWGEGRGEGPRPMDQTVRPAIQRPQRLHDLSLLALTPSPALAPHASLVHMFATVSCAFSFNGTAFLGATDSNGTWTLNTVRASSMLQLAAEAKRPFLILGTAFNFVHLLDHLAAQNARLALPPGSRVMETGGYKGRSRAVPKAELHALITTHLGIPPSHIVCEYGMSELSSQAYDRVAGSTPNSEPETRNFHFPPWARVQIISPETGREVGDGETGLIRVFDLANVRSVLAVQTEDLGVRRGDGFELLGRASAAEARGCSLMAEAHSALRIPHSAFA